MKNLKKKGFTIVELVIVIAVIAVLAAVLIPTFVNLTRKANMSADQVAVKNMNTLLATEFATEKPTELKQVIDMLDENGYNVDALIPLSKGYVFLWNSEENKIELVLEADAEEETKLEDGSSFINVEVSTSKDVLEALLDGKDITLTKDIVVDAEITLPENKDVTLNLNGYTYSTTQLNAGEVAQTSKYIKVPATSSLTIENGTFEGRGIMNNGNLIIKSNVVIKALDTNGGGCIKNKPGGNVVIEGGTFKVTSYTDWDENDKGGACAVENNGGKITINGGTFESVTSQYLVANLAGTMTINGGEFTAYRGVLACEGGEMTVNGGKFSVTNGAQSGWIVYAVGGSVTINNGEFSTVTNNDFTGNVIRNN